MKSTKEGKQHLKSTDFSFLEYNTYVNNDRICLNANDYSTVESM